MELNFKHRRIFEAISLIGLIVYFCLLLYLTVFQRIYRGVVTGMFFEQYTFDWKSYYTYSINLVPFKTIYGYLNKSLNTNVVITNLVGNVIAFVPMGFLMPIVFKKINNYKKTILMSVVTSVLIEIIQLLLKVGSADIDDVILNTFGGIIGFMLLGLLFIVSQKWRGRQKSNDYE